MKPAILITGVTGFLGKSLITYFSGIDRYTLFGHSRNAEEAQKQLNGYSVTLLKDCSADTLNKYSIHTVIHLAGIAHDLSNRYKESDYFAANFQNTIDVYKSFQESIASKFIFLSSIKAAVDEASLPVDEEVDPRPGSIYGKSKHWAERYILDHPSENKHVYILRPCMVHGPGNKGNLNLLYKFVKSGLPWPLGGFENQRSFLGVDNFNFIVDQLVTENIASGIYHLADNGTLSTRELIKVMSETLGKRTVLWNIPKSFIKFIFSLYDERMLSKLTDSMVVSNHKIVAGLGVPLPVSIEEGIQRTIRSFKTHNQ